MDTTQETIRLGKRCFVGNLAWKTSWQDLKDKFREAGNVVYTNVMRDDDGKGAEVTQFTLLPLQVVPVPNWLKIIFSTS